MLSGKDLAKPSTIAIPWTHVPVASKLGASPLKQSRHDGTFHLMEYRNRSRCFAHVFPCRMIYSTFIFVYTKHQTAKRTEQLRNVSPFYISYSSSSLKSTSRSVSATKPLSSIFTMSAAYCGSSCVPAHRFNSAITTLISILSL